MILNPITLPLAKVLNTLTTFIVEMRLHDNIKTSDLVSDLIDSCRDGKVDYGKGITHTFKTELPQVKDLSETSSALTITKPKLHQETIVIDKYKVIPLSWSQTLAKEAVVNGNVASSFLTYVFGMMQTQKNKYLYEALVHEMANWLVDAKTQATGFKANQVREITRVSSESIVDNRKINSSAIAERIRKDLNNFKIVNSKYNEYLDGAQVAFNELEKEDTCLYVSDVYWTEYLATALASLYHANKVSEMIDSGRIVLLPEIVIQDMKTYLAEDFTLNDANFVGILCEKQKFALATFYELQLSFVDPSTLYENSFLHFSYGIGTFATKNAVVYSLDSLGTAV